LNASDTQIRLSQTGEGSYDLGVVDGDKFAINRDGLTNEFVLSSGNVGIGTSSPSYPLDIAGASGTTLSVRNTSTVSSILLSNGSSTNQIFSRGANSSTGRNLAFIQGTSEAMRIDSAGNLLVGTTNPAAGYGNTESGIVLGGADDYTILSRTGNIPLFLNRNSTDGTIAEFRKDGTTVGSIGTASTDLYLGSGVAGLRFREGGPQLMPWNTTTNSANDNAIDIGKTDARFKDLYLSGGVYLGGTGNIGSGSTQGYDVYVSSGTGVTGNGLRFRNYITENAALPCRGDGVTIDNVMDLGASNARFDDIYATNGTIQTSDRNEKQDIAELSEAEQRVAVAAKGLLRKFRWKSAVEEKGDEARIHFGIIAQDLQAAFEAEGLNAGDYAMFINSTWTDEETGEEKSRMGVRYSELLAFIISAI
jgi:hypothetical protein